MPCVHQISALEFLQVLVVLAPAFRLGRGGDIHFIPEQSFDGSCDRAPFVGLCGQQTNLYCALTQKLPDRRDLRTRPKLDLDRDTVDGHRHDRTGSLALVRGVRTIW